MPRLIILTKESAIRLAEGPADSFLHVVLTKITITVGDENEIERVIETTASGGEQSYGRDRLRSELGEQGWKSLLAQIGATS